MSGKLDQSLDEIMKDSNTTRGPRRGRNGRLPNRKAAAKSKVATAAVIAPTGGVQKKTKPAKAAKTAAPAVVPQTFGESKISVSGLPEDVTEDLIKEFFQKSAGPVKRVLINYGPNGRPRGSCTIIFSRPQSAAAAVKLDGVAVDGRPMRIEVLMSAKALPPAQPPKALADRMQPKSVVKEDAKKKQKSKEGPAKATTNGAAKEARPKKSGRAGRPKKKTAEELDAEMQDYFGGEAPATNGTAQPAAAVNGGDTGMEEVI